MGMIGERVERLGQLELDQQREREELVGRRMKIGLVGLFGQVDFVVRLRLRLDQQREENQKQGLGCFVLVALGQR